MQQHSEDPLARLAPLAEPVRRALYEFVVGTGRAVDRDEAAAGVGIGRALAAFHLDRLAQAGLLDVEYHRRGERTGPGGGRPAKFYRRAARTRLSVTIPPRRYQLAAEILAAGVAASPDARSAATRVAAARGRALGSAATTGLIGALREAGYEPTVEPSGRVRLRNCPFDALVDRERELTCGLNLAMLAGLVEAAGDPRRAVIDVLDGHCCVAFLPAARGAGG